MLIEGFLREAVEEVEDGAVREHLLRPSRPASRQAGGIRVWRQHPCAASSRRPADLPRRVRCRPHTARIPDLREQSRSGVSRFRRQRAEAASGHRRHRRVLPHRLRQRASRRLSAQRPLDRPVRGGAREGAGLPQRRRRTARSCSCAAPPRRSTSSRRAGARPSSKPATRSSSAMSSTTRTSCRGSMLRDRLGAEAGRRADRRHRRVRPRRVSRRCCRRAPGSSR